MRNKKTHSLTFKKKLNKSKGIFRAYSDIQLKYGEELDSNFSKILFTCLVIL